MSSGSHPVGQAPTGHEVIPHAECKFTQLSGGRFRTTENPDD
jgi:hypothetical protein